MTEMQLRDPILALLAASILGVLAACGPTPAGARPAVVFAAASLTASFRELAAEFARRQDEHRVEVHFAGTPQLVVQVREGAPADVFASADATNMQRVVATGRSLGGPAMFAHNHLTIVVRSDADVVVRGLADLARDDLRVVLCGPEVPAGRYARQAFAKAGVEPRSVSDEPSVKAVVSKVALGEADAGVVYVTDARAARDRVDSVGIPEQHDVVAAYPVALLDGGRNPAAGAAFVSFVRSPDGQAILRRFGFSAP